MGRIRKVAFHAKGKDRSSRFLRDHCNGMFEVDIDLRYALDAKTTSCISRKSEIHLDSRGIVSGTGQNQELLKQ